MRTVAAIPPKVYTSSILQKTGMSKHGWECSRKDDSCTRGLKISWNHAERKWWNHSCLYQSPGPGTRVGALFVVGGLSLYQESLNFPRLLENLNRWQYEVDFDNFPDRLGRASGSYINCKEMGDLWVPVVMPLRCPPIPFQKHRSNQVTPYFPYSCSFRLKPVGSLPYLLSLVVHLFSPSLHSSHKALKMPRSPIPGTLTTWQSRSHPRIQFKLLSPLSSSLGHRLFSPYSPDKIRAGWLSLCPLSILGSALLQHLSPILIVYSFALSLV